MADRQLGTKKSLELFYTEKLLHTEILNRGIFVTEKVLHIEALTHRSFSSEKISHKAGMCTENLLQEKLCQSFTHSKLCTKYGLVLRSTTNLNKAPTSTTLYYKACTQQITMLLCTTRLAQSTSQNHFVLQSFAQSTSKYYFVLRSLHKACPSFTFYDKDKPRPRTTE